MLGQKTMHLVTGESFTFCLSHPTSFYAGSGKKVNKAKFLDAGEVYKAIFTSGIKKKKDNLKQS